MTQTNHANTNPTYSDYLSSGLTPLLCKGYHPKYNPKKDYKTAKEPAISGWNNADYVPPTLQEIAAWEKAGGWAGWVIPKGYIAIDNEDEDGLNFQDSLYKKKGIEPAIHKTSNGYHDLFKMSGDDLSAQSKVFTRCGLKETYRVGGKNYLILAPTNGRTWHRWKSLGGLPVLPEEFLPYDRKNTEHVLNCLGWQVGKAYHEGLFDGYTDLDAAFMSFLIESGITREQIHQAFALVFLTKYDEHRTEEMFDRTKQRIEAGDPVIGAGTFIQRIKEHGLEKVERFVRELQDARNQGEEPVTKLNWDSLKTCNDEIVAINEEDEWVVKGLIVRSEISTWYGPPGIAKSHMA